MKILLSHFVQSAEDDLAHLKGESIQLAFFKRSLFRYFDHTQFLEKLNNAGISVASVHAPAADIYHTHGDEFIKMLELIRDIYKIKVITVHPQRGERRQARSQYKKIEARIKELEIVIAYETFEDTEENKKKWISQIEEMHECFDALKFDFLGVTYDFSHADPAKYRNEIRHFHKRIHVVHLSDALQGMPFDINEKHQHYALGYGTYPVIEFLDLLETVGYAGFVVLEYLPKYKEYLIQDAQLLRQYFAGDKEPFLKEYQARQELGHL